MSSKCLSLYHQIDNSNMQMEILWADQMILFTELDDRHIIPKLDAYDSDTTDHLHFHYLSHVSSPLQATGWLLHSHPLVSPEYGICWTDMRYMAWKRSKYLVTKVVNVGKSYIPGILLLFVQITITKTNVKKNPIKQQQQQQQKTNLADNLGSLLNHLPEVNLNREMLTIKRNLCMVVNKKQELLQHYRKKWGIQSCYYSVHMVDDWSSNVIHKTEYPQIEYCLKHKTKKTQSKEVK